MAKQITVRNVSGELGRRLERISRERNESLNTTVLRILEHATGLDSAGRDLSRYTTWTQTDLKEFEQALKEQREVDEELWK
jgi:hypothetical protein